MNPSVQTDMASRLFTATMKGDVSALSTILSGMTTVNVRDDRGWTALMMAARHGHSSIVKLLLEKGCDTELINSSGQTALEIAKFWNFSEIVNILEKNNPTTSSIVNTNDIHDDINFFATGFIDRAAHKRKDKVWLDETMRKDNTIFILFKNLDALVIPQVDHSTTQPKGAFRLYKASYKEIQCYLESEKEENLVIFLGIQRLAESKADVVETSDEDIAWFALNMPEIAEEVVVKLHERASWLSPFPGSLQIDPRDSGVYAQARSVLAWHDRYGYCATCGKLTTAADGGYKRDCTDDSCRSRNGKGVHNTCYPRVDPTVIMAVICPEGKRLLLGRGPRFPRGMYSCLAGFIEPGETLEAACRREVLEEAGVDVGRVQYHSCQPWPMPSSLMIGCLAHATSENIHIDKEELEDARWFSRQDVINMINNRHPERFFIPPEQAIAHILIRAWVNMTSNL